MYNVHCSSRNALCHESDTWVPSAAKTQHEFTNAMQRIEGASTMEQTHTK